MSTKKLCKVLLVAFFAVTLSTISYAQENRILMTTDQQYQNSAANADFESWINWALDNTAPPDGWTKVLTPTIAKETASAKMGSASLKITGNAGQGVSQAVSIEKNTTYTVSFYYKVNTGHSCTFSLTGDSTGAFTLTGASGLASAVWTRKAFVITTNASDTTLIVKMVADAASNVFYLDGVSVTKGIATPAFGRAVINDSGAQILYGDLTINGTTNLNGDVNLGDLSTDNITLTGTLKSPTATDVSIQSTTGILKLNKASADNELRVFENAVTPAAFTSLRHQNLTTSAGALTINPAGGITNITGALAVSTTLTATGDLSAARLSTDSSNYYDFGNASGNAPISNGTVNTNLNADKLDGLDASATGANAHVLATDASGNISVVNVDASGYLRAGASSAGVGSVRIPNNSWINARNSTNLADINLISLNTSNQVSFGATPVAAFTAAGTIAGSGSPTITGFGTINGATLSGGTLSGGAYSGTSLTPATLTTGDGVVYTLSPAISVSTPGTTGYTALKVNVTETSVGTGTKNILDLSVGGAQKFVVNSTGSLSIGIIPGANVSGDITGNSANVNGIVTTIHGGTGANLSSGAQGGVTYMAASSIMAVSAAGSSGQVLQSNVTGAPTWTTDISGKASNVTGTVAADHGGTGLTSYTAGDMVYYSSGTALSKVNIGTANKVLISSGTAPQWSDTLTLAGTLSVTGSGSSSFTNGKVGIGTASPTAPLDVAKTYTTASAIDYGAIVEPTYNAATAGANKYTALLVKATESDLAGYSGAKLLLDLQAGLTPTSKFSVDNSGNVVSGTINSQTIGAVSNLAAVNVSGDLAVGGGYGSTGVTMDSSGNLKLDGNIYIKGVMYRENLTDLQVQNNTITLNASDAPSDADAYIGVMSGGTKLAPTYTGQLKWTAATDTWDISNDVSLATGKAYKVNNVSVLSATTLGSNVVNSSLQTVGTIGTGVWRGTPVEVAYGGTNLTSYAIGDLVYASGATTLSKLADVATGSVLVSGGAGAAPSYSSSPTISGILTVQGAGASSFVGNVGIGTASPAGLLDVYNKPANASGMATAALIKPDYSLLNTAGDGYTALKINVTDALAGATGAKNLLDLAVEGVSKAKVDSTGAMTIQGLTIGSTALTSSTIGSEGAKLVGTKTGYTNFTATEASVQGALSGIDTALGAISGGAGNFTNLTVTGTSDLQGAISNTTAANGGAVTIADALTQTGSGNQVTFAGNVDATNGLDVTGALLTAANGASITGGLNNNTGGITNAGAISGATTITASGNIITTGTGAITSANGLTVSANGASITGGVNNNAGGITNAGAISGATTVAASSYIRSLASVGLIPEYDNATPMPDGADNFGTLSLLYANSHNYYEWTTSEPTTQDYDIVIRYRLPDGFSSFDASPIKLWNKVSAAPGSTAVNVTMLDTAGSAVTLTGGSTLQNTSWAESTITLDAAGKTFTPGGYITIIIKMSADQAKTADVGELTLKGNW
ncbi:MAG: hypothetical protein A2117_01005 [Candidatus Wildermuthbacteria bacterium GWA2_46_15]|uniref:CBM-cenC domain-containing protein n=1 Tax=Candidatus Wildermuthbacteria bacterium GWA2_46_15 TaxID=1802443 RepID=A0A1G2QQ59_9BACT|nr:MAG: hypothetical protein A2117_01005 [Candidatus Wildermuthbacteria bacterium GWA2_46_15]